MKNWEIYPIRNLGAGMQMMVSPFLISNEELAFVKNYDFSTLGELKKISGYTRKGDAITGATSIAGGSPFYTTTQEEIIAVDNDSDIDFYIYNSSTDSWDAQGLSLTTGSKVEFAQFLGGLFAVSHGNDSHYYDGSTWSTTTNLISAPKAKFAMPYYDRLFLGNITVGATDHPSRIAMSSLPADDYSITWDMTDTGNYFDVSPKDGDEVTGLGKNFNRLLIFKEEGLWRYDTNSLYQFPGAPGTNSHRSIQNVLNWTIFFHKSGVYGINQDEVVKLSRSIQPIIDGVKSTILDSACAYTLGDKYYLYLGNVVNEDYDLDIDHCLVVLDVANMRWSVKDLKHQPLAFWKYRDDRSDVTYDDSSYEYDHPLKTYDGLVSANDFVHFGDNQGNIFEFDDDDQFNGSNIEAYVLTPNYYFSGVESLGKLQALMLYIKNARRIRCFYSIDDSTWVPIKKYKEKSDRIFYQFDNEIVANRIKFKFIDNSNEPRGIIRGFDIFFTSYDEIV